MSRIQRSPGELAFDACNIALMLCVAFVMAFPFWYCVVYSLNESPDAQMGGVWIWPRRFTLANYRYVLSNPQVGHAYLVTIARTALGSLLHLVVTGFAAYTLSKRALPGRRILTYYFVIPMFVGGSIVSMYVLMAKIGLLNNFLIYILPGVFSFFDMAIIRAFIEELPASLEESARIDGASSFRTFFQIVIPLCMPIVATILIFNGVSNWLDFYTNLVYVSRTDLTTLQFLLFRVTDFSRGVAGSGETSEAIAAGMVRESMSTGTLKMTTLVVVTLPILFIYPFFQKFIIKGILIGSIKG